MFRNLAIFTLTIVLVFLLATGCGPSEEAPVIEEPDAGEAEETVEPDEETGEAELPGDEAVFTLDELAEYDGQDGRPAYIAVDGIVYDVSIVSVWGSGTHFGFEAGIDATEALQSAAPHGAAQLNQAEVVGTLAE